MASFDKWGIQKENMTMMLRDNACNAIKACCNWGITHFGCIGHTLHLIVGALFVQKRGTGTGTIINDNDNGNAGGDEQLDDIVNYDEEELFEAIHESNNENYKCRIKCSKVVGHFRTVTKNKIIIFSISSRES
jgi:hypothetical protein